VEKVTRLQRGDPPPPLDLPDRHHHRRGLEELRGGGRLLVFFFPEAGTPDCTEQACVVREARADLADLETAVVGISPDPPEVLAAFDDDHGLGFPLLCDDGARTAAAWGAQRRGQMLRSAVLVGRDGLVLDAWYGVRPRETAVKAAMAIPPA
jgi:peroxiredoxin Q/BCP